MEQRGKHGNIDLKNISAAFVDLYTTATIE